MQDSASVQTLSLEQSLRSWDQCQVEEENMAEVKMDRTEIGTMEKELLLKSSDMMSQ